MEYDHQAILYTSRGTLPLRLARAERFGARLRGLIGYPWHLACPPRHGLWLPDCQSVHGLGIGLPLELLYLVDCPGQSKRHRVVGSGILRPGRIGFFGPAQHTLELGHGTVLPGQVQAGDWLEWTT
jgi:hypothetical protein